MKAATIQWWLCGRRRAPPFLAIPFWNIFWRRLPNAVTDSCPKRCRGAPEIALVSAVLHLADDARPVLLVGVVALDRGLQLEPHAGVANLLSSQNPQSAVDVLAHDERLEPLDAHEVLLVHRTQPLHAGLQLLDELLKFIYVQYENSIALPNQLGEGSL